MSDARIEYFETSAAFRAWLKRHHKTAAEVQVGFVKSHARGEEKRSMSWPESVAEALCFGWIDGRRWRVDGERYAIRFTPRRKGSRWSAINVRMVGELEAAGRMMEAGRAVFAARKDVPGYTYQKREAELDAGLVKEFRKKKGAWEFFEKQAPSYRKLVAWWVMSAKKEETRERRFRKLVEWSGEGKRL